MSQENVEIARQLYEAWNRSDLEWLLNHTTPAFEFRTVQLFPDIEPVYRGHEAMSRGSEEVGFARPAKRAAPEVRTCPKVTIDTRARRGYVGVRA
jgi:ketosteroid isomerase-like protein